MEEDDSKLNTKQTLGDDNAIPRTPKLLEKDASNSNDLKIQTAELVQAEDEDDDDKGQSAELGRMSHLDSQKSYKDLVNGQVNGMAKESSALGVSNQDSRTGHPVRENVISNMRGRSIVSGSREVLSLSKNDIAIKQGNKAMGGSPSQVDAGSAPITSGTDNEQSMHRITNLSKQLQVDETNNDEIMN